MIKKNNSPHKPMERKMPCPRCSVLLKRVHLRKIRHKSGAILDVCDTCDGMWLDGPEVKLLYNHSNKKGKK